MALSSLSSAVSYFSSQIWLRNCIIFSLRKIICNIIILHVLSRSSALSIPTPWSSDWCLCDQVSYAEVWCWNCCWWNDFLFVGDSYCIIIELYYYTIGYLFGMGLTIGRGLFEADAIQFGLDQLLKALTPKCLSFTGTMQVRMLEDWLCSTLFTLVALLYFRSLLNVGKV